MPLLDIVIDVSDAQGAVHWGDVFAAGIRVAMIKATEGATFTARTWVANSAAARAAGIKVIPYHFMTNADPAAQADHFQAVAAPAAGAAYALDWEERDVNGHDITGQAAQVEAMGSALTAALGRNPLGYWGIPGSTPGTPTAIMNGWDRWVPRYRNGAIPSFSGAATSPFNPPGGNFLFWQYTAGGVVGGAVDRSVALFDTDADLFSWCG